MKITLDTDSLDLTAEEAQALIAAGVSTPELLSRANDGAELVEGCLVLDPGIWRVMDEGGDETEIEAEDGDAAAKEYVEGGDWGSGEKTTWVSVSYWREGIDGCGDIREVSGGAETVTIEPEEPPCIDGEEHDWQSPHKIVGGIKENPGVWGHGGGVKIYECCLRCGCGRVTDTWGQNSGNGKQGLHSSSYEPEKYAEEIRAMQAAE